MKDKNRKRHAIHFFYVVMPLICYVLIQNLSMFAAVYFHWNLQVLNLVSGCANLAFLYFVFYRKFMRLKSREQFIGTPYKTEDGPTKVWRKKPPAVSYLWVILAGGSACIFLNNLVAFSGLNERIDSYEKVSKAIYSGNYIWMVIQVVIVAALVEEVLFRGLVYQACALSIGALPAAFLSSFIFAALHGNLLQALYAFIFGLVLAFVFERFQSMSANILFHMAANLISVLGTTTACLQFMYQSVFVMGAFTVMMGLLFFLCLFKIKTMKMETYVFENSLNNIDI